MLVSMILVLLGCETGGLSFHKTVYNNREERNTEEMKSVVTVRKSADSDTVTVETIGGGEFESEDIESDAFEGMESMVFGVITAVLLIVFFLVVFTIIMAVDIFILNPLSVGGKRFMVKSVEDVAQVKEIAFGFDHSYKNVVKVMFHMDLSILLWTLLFIIPGIIKMYEYYMVPYILTENPDMEYRAVLQMSRDMMDGNKWKTFVLGLSFILWDFLGALTLGIVEVLYVQPYRCLTFAALYCQFRNTRVMNRIGMPGNGQQW